MREVQDHYFREARREGYRSRAAYKLIEIDTRRKVMSHGDRVLDCGAAPGSWSQVAARRIGSRGRVVAIDLKEIDPANLPPTVDLLQGDLREVPIEELGGRPFDVIVSDMAPDTTGDPFGDHHRSVRLCQELLDRAGILLRPGGNLVMKVFEGEAYRELLDRASNEFERAKGFKPKASRSESVEMFIVCHGYQGPASTDEQHELPSRKPSRGWGSSGPGS
ncbi:MAG: RlmE family RNA methyltransferase [Phycisphaerales bacterium]|nr:RlmE family RNA methyltransferase [Phycisphaerales bacterium]